MTRKPEPIEDSRLTTMLRRWAFLAQKRAWTTIGITAVVSVLLGFYAVTHIGFNVDPNSFFSADLRFQKAIVEFEEHFPVLTNSLLIVLDGETPERTRKAAEILMPALAAEDELFIRVFQPGEDRFFERYGLLYGSLEEVDDFADHMARIQPVLAELALDPTLPTLTRVVQQGLEAVNDGDVDGEGWDLILDHLRAATRAARLGDNTPLSWESILISGTGFEPRTRTVVIADPILDLDKVLAAEEAIKKIREKALELGLVPEQGVELRITGYPALNHEEMIGLATDTTAAGMLSFVLVVLVLFRAFRSARMVLCAAITLIMGLIATAAFAAAFIRVLNPVSITFSVLVIGLGIDFMIHLGMHFVEEAAGGKDVPEAIDGSVRSTGEALVLCALTTGVGFLAFVPTDFSGVSDLGLAAAGGMVAILLLTLTLFPALIAVTMKGNALAKLVDRGPARRIHIPPARHPGWVVAIAVALGVLALPLLPRVDLDTNVVSFRNQSTESVSAFKDLLASQTTTPWYLDAMVPSLDQAVALADEIRELPTVDRVLTLASFVPEDQEDKLEILGDVSLMLGLPELRQREPAPAQAQWNSLSELRDHLAGEPLGPDSELSRSVALLAEALDEFLADASSAEDPRIGKLANALLAPVPDQIERLSASLEVEAVTRADLPPGLVERMLSADGHARVQAYPSASLWDADAMTEFVESIRPIWGNITGLPVNLVESARATWSSLRRALSWSVAAITLLLLVLWRRVGNTAIALGPLLLAVLLTQVMTVLLPIPLNFANVIVLPLLLGIGIDSAIHLVERADRLPADSGGLLDTTTARAVFFSALSTVASFGTLTLSAHRGISNLGVLLTLGMIWTVTANLVLLPALLAVRDRSRARRDSKG